MKKLGIDVSTFQGAINWARVKTSGIEFAMIRGGYGRFEIDEQFTRNYLNAKTFDMPIGIYHYSYATNTTKAKQEAQFVINYLKDKKLEYPVAFDIEDKTQMSLTKTQLTNIVKAFCSTLEKAGYYVVIYSSKYFLENKLYMNKLTRYDVWVAQWNDTCTYSGNYGMWQFSDSGRCAGIQGPVDVNYAYKDYPTIIKNAHLNGWEKPTKPKRIEVGTKVILNNTPLYISSTTAKPTTRISGTFYIYDGKDVNGRYRITTAKSNCMKTPVTKYVTGWIDKGGVKIG